MPALDLPVRLRMVRAGPDMCHPTQPDEFFEVTRNQLRPVIRNDPWSRLGEQLARTLQNDFNVTLGHLLSQLPMNDIAAASVQHGAEVVEGGTDVDV